METFALEELVQKTKAPEWFIIDMFKPHKKLCYLINGHLFIKTTPGFIKDLQTSWKAQEEFNYWMLRKMEACKLLQELKLSRLN